MLDEQIVGVSVWGRVFEAKFFYQFDSIVNAVGIAEGADCYVSGDLVGMESIGDHEIEGFADRGEGGIGGFAGLGEEDMVSGSIRAEGRAALCHVAEERDGVVDG